MNTDIMPAVANVLSGILFIAVSVPLFKRKIKMNDLYGFRIPKAFKSEENWYSINEYGAGQLITASLFMILIGVVFLFVPVKENLHLFIAIGPMTLSILIAIVKTLIYAKKL